MTRPPADPHRRPRPRARAVARDDESRSAAAVWGRIAALAAALLLALLVGLPLALSAQDLPEGWQMRADRPDMDLTQVSFSEMPPGWHVTTGPAVILWNPEMQASGDYRVEAEIFLFDPGQRREAFGFFVGGADLDGPGQVYTYFLIRNGGQYLVKERDGADTRTLVGWSDDDAIHAFADRAEGESSVKNVLAMERRAGMLHFEVNGEEVAEVPVASLPVDGVVGLRVNHALNLHISRFEVIATGDDRLP